MINNLELQVYASFKQYSGDHRNYINSNEFVQSVEFLKNNQTIHGNNKANKIEKKKNTIILSDAKWHFNFTLKS